jgi:hypothetical protein
MLALRALITARKHPTKLALTGSKQYHIHVVVVTSQERTYVTSNAKIGEQEASETVIISARVHFQGSGSKFPRFPAVGEHRAESAELGARSSGGVGDV